MGDITILEYYTNNFITLEILSGLIIIIIICSIVYFAIQRKRLLKEKNKNNATV